MVAADLRATIIVKATTDKSGKIPERLQRSMAARRSVATLRALRIGFGGEFHALAFPLFSVWPTRRIQGFLAGGRFPPFRTDSIGVGVVGIVRNQARVGAWDT